LSASEGLAASDSSRPTPRMTKMVESSMRSTENHQSERRLFSARESFTGRCLPLELDGRPKIACRRRQGAQSAERGRFALPLAFVGGGAMARLFSCCVPLGEARQEMNQRAEGISALLKAGKLVVGGAGRGEEDDWLATGSGGRRCRITRGGSQRG